MSLRFSSNKVNQLISINQETIYALDSRLGSASKNLGIAQSAINASTTETEKDVMTRWQNLIANEYRYFKYLTDNLRVKQNLLKIEDNQLEESIIANCGGLNATDAPFTGDSSSL